MKHELAVGSGVGLLFKSSGGGGGGNSGSVESPQYIKDFHKDMLINLRNGHTLDSDISMVEAIEDGWGNNPFEDITAYNPTARLSAALAAASFYSGEVEALKPQDNWDASAVGARKIIFGDTMPDSRTRDYIDSFAAEIAQLNPLQDWRTMMLLAVSEWATNLSSDPLIANAVLKYEQNQQIVFNRVVNRFMAGAVDVNAVVSSAFVQGLAILEAEHQKNVAQFEANVRLQDRQSQNDFVKTSVGEMSRAVAAKANLQHARLVMYIQLAATRAQAVMQGAGQVTQHILNKVDRQYASAMLTGEVNRVAIVAEKERVDREADYSVKSRTWRLELFQHGANLLAAYSGGIASPAEKPGSTAGSMIGGALTGAASGAAAGAAIGSVIPGVGTAIGAVVGAGIGGIGGSMQ